MIKLIHGDCLEEMKKMESNSVDSICCDPPYGLSFMGKKWDYDVPSEDIWRECLRVLKPGGHLLAFAGTRTQHRMAVRIEDAGFEIRDMIAWVYGSGFPKSLNIGKAVDKLQGNEREVTGSNPNYRPVSGKEGYLGQSNFRQTDGMATSTKGTSEWEGWGTALKPALEPITVARKPLIGTVAENVLTHGTGGINIDGCRVGTEEQLGRTNNPSEARAIHQLNSLSKQRITIDNSGGLGRFPANFIHDGSEEVVGLFPTSGGGSYSKSGGRNLDGESRAFGAFNQSVKNAPDNYGDSGSAARFFYCAKSSRKDRGEGNNHPTVKPTDLMRYLCRLVTPPNGIVLDPFMGSGSTGKAAKLEGFSFIGIEREAEYIEIARARIDAAQP